MVAIQWPAIDADVGPEATLFLILLAALVAVPAQRLQTTQPKFVPVTAVWLDVVGDDGGDDEAFLQTALAQRMGAELRMGTVLPTAQAVPVARVSWMQHQSLFVQ